MPNDLFPRTTPELATARGDGARDHGSHLGRGRNARRWSLCPLGDRARYD